MCSSLTIVVANCNCARAQVADEGFNAATESSDFGPSRQAKHRRHRLDDQCAQRKASRLETRSEYCPMRLLDLIAQGRGAHVFADDGRELPGASQFTATIQACPLRYVLSDELARCATQLAFAEGDRLSACLDLVRVPAQSLWVEWAGVPQQETLQTVPSLRLPSIGEYRHA